ncbi:hypothetical protein CASFOL_031745 [Castilleja foliolosa]|uniref:Uncharacterized protein n=1 Tax=Castilleja foliolosa TaxID=1961234 RepID=A0ABD3C678_9LAMI
MSPASLSTLPFALYFSPPRPLSSPPKKIHSGVRLGWLRPSVDFAAKAPWISEPANLYHRSEKLSDDDIEQTLNSLDRQISRYVASDRPICTQSVDSSSFLDSVDQLIAAVRDWTPLADDKNISS